jgi:hypothetical protein
MKPTTPTDRVLTVKDVGVILHEVVKAVNQQLAVRDAAIAALEARITALETAATTTTEKRIIVERDSQGRIVAIDRGGANATHASHLKVADPKPHIRYRGPWQPGTYYDLHDGVTHDGRLFVAKANCLAADLDSFLWERR